MSRQAEDERDFIVRQYRSLIETGISDQQARLRIDEVLGEGVAASLDAVGIAESPGTHRLDDAVAAAAEAAKGSAATARVAFAGAREQARVIALDWWRPVRPFLGYITVLLAIAVWLIIEFMTYVLPSYEAMNASLGVGQGTAGWVMEAGGARLFGPLVLIGLTTSFVGVALYVMRLRLSALRAFPFQHRLPWLFGRSGATYRLVLALEYAAALQAAGVDATRSLLEALKLINWPWAKPLERRGEPLGKKLETAAALGTFAAEIAWQHELQWTRLQVELDLKRDRLILAARILAYAFIGYLVAVLYLPVFSIALGIGKVV
ncbi:MAG TPA: hypothetical protein VFK96_07330 [Gammaproteobacteria bacterium]|nr:hypothetical protein [Gammaproteobacteria bacterium]